MKITSLQENLKNGLSLVGHIAGKNQNLPILNNILIRAENGIIKLSTTDLEIGIVTTVRGKVEEEGVFTVEAKIISDYVSLLPNQKTELNLKENKIDVLCGNYHTVIKGQSAEEFPLIPQIERNIFYKVKADDLKKALSQVVFAVSNSETRLELTGVLFTINKDELVLTATDSYRLAEKKIKIETNSTSEAGGKVIVPAKTLQELSRVLSAVRTESVDDKSNELSFYYTDNQILFVLNETELVSRLIEGQYPDYQQIIPQNIETKATVEKNELVRAVKAAAIFSKSGVNDVNLDFPEKQNKVVVSSSSGLSGENITNIEAEVSGRDNGMVVNYRYLLEGLNSITGDKVNIQVVNGNAPCIMRAASGDEGYLYLIMPIKQ